MKEFSFHLAEYYTQTQKYYFFFDGLFMKEKRNKKDILNLLKIPESTYRTNRLKKYVKNKNHLALLEYFKYESKLFPQEIYESCLSKIMFSFYYKDTKTILTLQQELEEYIFQNNYLKPIFVIFQIILDIATTEKDTIMMDKVIPKLEYINLFPKDYYLPCFEYLVLLLNYYCNQTVDEVRLKNYALQFLELSWLYNFIKGSKENEKQNEYGAMIHFERALKDYKDNLNIARIIPTIDTLSLMYNMHNQYELSLEKSSLILQHVFYQTEDRNWQKNISMHYLFSLFMLDRLDEIKHFFRIQNHLESLPTISIILGILTARKLKIPYHKFNPFLEKILDNDKELQLFIQEIDQQIHKGRSKELKCYSSFYFKKIAEKINLDF